MNLEELKNHRILPYFFRKRFKANNNQPLEVRFLDLQVLQQILNEKPLEISDTELEKVLYGKGYPKYTGWTLKLLQIVAEKTGWDIDQVRPIVTAAERSVSLKPRSRFRSTSYGKFLWGEFVHRQWNARRNLRYKVQELRGQMRAAFHEKQILNAGKLVVNLGAGEERYQGYIRVDWGKDQDVYDNVVALKKFQPDSIEKIYSNHVLEHIPPALISTMLKRWWSVLKPGGTICVRMPDAKASICNLDRSWKEADPKQLERLGFPNLLDKEAILEGILDHQAAAQLIYGWSYSTPYSWDESNQHKSLWTPELTQQRLAQAGFKVEFCENLGTLQTVAVARK